MNIVQRLLANGFLIGVTTLASALFVEHSATVNALPIVPQCLTGSSTLNDVPDWVINKQQYEPTYIYCGSLAGHPTRAGTRSEVPDWVATRQQYESTYIYRPMSPAEVPVPDWVANRQHYDPTYVYRRMSPAEISVPIPDWRATREQYEGKQPR